MEFIVIANDLLKKVQTSVKTKLTENLMYLPSNLDSSGSIVKNYGFYAKPRYDAKSIEYYKNTSIVVRS